VAWLSVGKIWQTLRTTLNQWSEDDGSLMSAAMAYYAAFSLFPLCLVLIAGLGFVMRFLPQAKDAQQQLIDFAEQNASPWLAEQLSQLLSGIEAGAAVGGPLGLLTLLFGAIGFFTQFDAIFDRIWRVEAPRQQTGIIGTIKRTLYDRLQAFLVLLGVGFLIVVVFLLNMVLAGVREYVELLPAGKTLWHFGQLGLALALNTLLFAAIYKFFPRTTVRWREAIAGGLLVAVVWEIGQQLLVAFVIGDKYSAYGIVGSFIAVLLWVYYASVAIFLGAEFVEVICRDCAGVRERASQHTAE